MTAVMLIAAYLCVIAGLEPAAAFLAFIGLLSFLTQHTHRKG